MKSPLLSLRKGFVFVAAFAMLVAPLMLAQTANAGQITLRKLTLEANGTTGGSAPAGIVNHLFTFTIPSATDIGSIKFEYCTTAADTGTNTCVAPTGLDLSTATMTFENGVTGFTNLTHVSGSEANVLYISKVTAAAPPGANTIVSYRLSGVTNPTAANETFFVRLSTYASTDTTGTATDTGTVTAATAEPIVLDGVMPESLVFCTGETIGLTAGVPDCSTATDGTISFPTLFGPTETSVASSQMAASTNAGQGYAITINGATLTSGANTIAPMATIDTSKKGVSQFGLNLKANVDPVSLNPFGTEVAPTPNAANYRGQAFGDYSTVDSFKFTSGDIVAQSDNGGVGGTDAQIFTASYIVNVPGSQPAGGYSTTLTYICTPTF